MEATKKSRFVKINKNRGYGDSVFYVKGYNSKTDEFTLERVTEGSGSTGCITIYRAHCYVDRDTLKAR